MRIRLAYRGVHGTKQGRKEGKRALSRSPSPLRLLRPLAVHEPSGAPLWGHARGRPGWTPVIH